MRIITAIVSVIMGAVLYDFSNTASFAGAFANSEELSGIAGGALIGALLWFLGGAIVYFYPRAALVLYLLSFAVMGLTQLGTSVETDLLVYMWFGPVFSLTAYFGWKEKRNSDTEKAAVQNQMTIQQTQMNYFLSQQRTAAQNKALNDRVAQYQANTGIGTDQKSAVQNYGAQYRLETGTSKDHEKERLERLAQFKAGPSATTAPEEQVSRMNFCPNCGSGITGPGRFCPNCGTQFA